MSTRKTKKAIAKVKSINEMIEYMETIKSCYSSRAIIRLLKQRLSPYEKQNLHLLELTLTKDEYLLFEYFKRNRKKIKAIIDSPK